VTVGFDDWVGYVGELFDVGLSDSIGFIQPSGVAGGLRLGVEEGGLADGGSD